MECQVSSLIAIDENTFREKANDIFDFVADLGSMMKMFGGGR